MKTVVEMNEANVVDVNVEALVNDTGVNAVQVQQATTPTQYDFSKIDLKSLGLTEADYEKINDVKKDIGDIDNLKIANYGKGISTRNGEYTKEILSLVHNKDLDVTGQKLNEVIVTAKSINANNLISKNQSGFARLPVIGGLFRSVEKAKENFAMKFNDTNKQIDSLVSEIESNQQGLNSRIKLLDKMFDSVKEEQKELGIYIASGQLILNEIQDEIKSHTNHDVNDQVAIQRVYDLNNQYNTLEKRLYDLYVLQQASIQMLPQIRIIQNNNLLLVDKFHSVKNITIPAWKNQISLAISLNEQKNSVDLANAIDDATNDLLRRNAELLHTNSVKTAKAAQRSIIDPNTLAFTQNMLIKTVNDVMQIQQQGVEERERATIQLKTLQDNYKNIVMSDSIKLTMK